MRSYHGGQGSAVSHDNQQWCRDIVRQVRNDARALALQQRARIECQGVVFDDGETAGIMVRYLVECRDRPVIPLDRDHALRADGEQRARQPAGAGPDFEDRHVVIIRARRARNPRRQIEIEEEILPE